MKFNSHERSENGHSWDYFLLTRCNLSKIYTTQGEPAFVSICQLEFNRCIGLSKTTILLKMYTLSPFNIFSIHYLLTKNLD